MKLPAVILFIFGWLCQLTAEEVPHPHVVKRTSAPNVPIILMPDVGDYTSMWWAEGFPSVVKGAPWLRCIQTGHYAMYLNTETLKIAHLGAVPSKLDYTASGLVSCLAQNQYQPADLNLNLTVDGEIYHCRKAGAWSRYTGPRIIESGRFLQRADVTDLVFTSADGVSLNVDARFETAAWSNRLGFILAVRLKQAWTQMSLRMQLGNAHGSLQQIENVSSVPKSRKTGWHQVALAFDPVTMKKCAQVAPVKIQATEKMTGKECPVKYDASLGWHRVHLDGVVPVLPSQGKYTKNDAVERIRLVLSNPSPKPELARLMFEKTSSGFRQRIGSAITGISATLRDRDGHPTGIPVQLSKNWHNKPESGVYRGLWFHGITQMRLPPESETELELTISYGHWGGVAAASHAQLSLIGWGSNQLWEQSALGAWGESICYDPSQVQANCTITDVRPVMVSKPGEKNHWKWTNNVGGGDFFRFFDPSGKRVAHSGIQTIRHRQGPCLTEVTYAGNVTQGIQHSATVSLARTDDIVRGVYVIRMHVHAPTDFSRFVLFQTGADTYSYTAEKKMATGNETGLLREWNTQWGGNQYRHDPMECAGRIPWVSLHESLARGNVMPSPWANRGLIIRSWKARLGGKDAAPWIAERGAVRGKNQFSTIDILPPPGVTRLEPGDFLEATIEHLVIPKAAKDYYGSNGLFRSALKAHGNTWKMVFREAVGNDLQIDLQQGSLVRKSPDVRIMTVKGAASFHLSGGLGYVPVTFLGLPSHHQGELLLDGKPLDQSVHGNDFWQTDFNPVTQLWSRTYNIPAQANPADKTQIQFICP